MQLLYSIVLWGFVAPLANTEAIIGYDGKEHHWHPHRDGLHDKALHHKELPRRSSLSHPRLRQFDTRELPHMLNQANTGPNIVLKRRNLHIASRTRHVTHPIGFGVSAKSRKSPKNLSAATGNATQDAAMGLNRMEQNMLDSVYGNEEKVQDKTSSFRSRHVRQSETYNSEDITAREVEEQRAHRRHLVYAGGAPSGAGPMAPSPGPMGAPGAPGPMPAEDGGMFSMDEDSGAADQGFSGEKVEHDNMKTMTKDWRGEYGPRVHSDYVKICAAYPDNQWCRDRGYHKKKEAPKSAAARSAGSAILAFVVAAYLY